MAKMHQMVINLGALVLIVTLSVYNYYYRKERFRFLDYNPAIRNESHVDDCDFFSGKWVYDNQSYPLYKARECERFMFDEFACEKYGRKDLKHQHWRWQPHGCDIPRFNGKALLERLRGKRLVFVGDSVSRNQWVSMVCLVQSSIPNDASKNMSLNGSLYTFQATEYNATIEFYWSPFLVESNSDNPTEHHSSDRVIRIEAIEKHASQWGDADILVFNTFLWWVTGNLNILQGSFENPNQVYKEENRTRSYKMALKTLSNWLDTHLNRTKTQLFYIGLPSAHYEAEEWGMPKYQKCINETDPITKEDFEGGGSYPEIMHLVEVAISKLKIRGLTMQLLNIGRLSKYRKDGHPATYKKQWHPISEENLSNPMNINADCTHWCLPGVPDIWNEILNAYIVKKS